MTYSKIILNFRTILGSVLLQQMLSIIDLYIIVNIISFVIQSILDKVRIMELNSDEIQKEMIENNQYSEGFISILHRMKVNSVLTFYSKTRFLIQQLQKNGGINTIQPCEEFYLALNACDLMAYFIVNFPIFKSILQSPQQQVLCERSLQAGHLFILKNAIDRARLKKTTNDQEILGQKYLRGKMIELKKKQRNSSIKFYADEKFIPDILSSSTELFKQAANKENLIIELTDLQFQISNKRLLFIYFGKVIGRFHNKINQLNQQKPLRKYKELTIICMCLQMFLCLKQWRQVLLKISLSKQFQQSIIFKMLSLRKGSISIVRSLQDFDDEALEQQEQLCLKLIHLIDKKQ